MCLYLTSLGQKNSPLLSKGPWLIGNVIVDPTAKIGPNCVIGDEAFECTNILDNILPRSKCYNWTRRCDWRRGLYQAQHSVERSQNQATLMDGLLYHRMEVITVEMVALFTFCPLVVRWVSGSEWRMCVCLEKTSQSKMRWGVFYGNEVFWHLFQVYVNGGKVLPHKSIGTSVAEPQIIMWYQFPIHDQSQNPETSLLLCDLAGYMSTWLTVRNPRDKWSYKKLPLLPRRLRHSSSSSNIIRSFLSLWNDRLHPVKFIKCDWGCVFPPKQLNMHIMFMARKFAQIIPVCCGV